MSDAGQADLGPGIERIEQLPERSLDDLIASVEQTARNERRRSLSPGGCLLTQSRRYVT